MKTITKLIVAGVVVWWTSTGHAEIHHSVEYTVNQEHDAFDIEIKAGGFVLIYLDTEIKHAFNSNKESFEAENLEKLKLNKVKNPIVLLRAKPDLPAGAWGNVVFMSEQYILSVGVKVASRDKDPARHVFLKSARDGQPSSLPGPAHTRRKASDRQTIADELLQRSDIRRIGRVVQTADHIMVRVERIQWVGSNEAFLYFAIENKSQVLYRLADVAVLARKANVTGVVSFEKNSTKHPELVGVIPRGKRRRGVVHLRDASLLANGPVTLTVSESQGQRAVSVLDIRW